MPPHSRPLALSTASIYDFLHLVLTQTGDQSHHSSASDFQVLVCGSRDDFLQDLLQECSDGSSSSDGAAAPIASGQRSTVEHGNDNAGIEEGLSPLIPSIALVTLSSRIRLTFAPSLMHLRAHLGKLGATTASDVLNPAGAEASGEAGHRGAGARDRPPRQLFICNPLGAHRHTNDHSAQGLSRTLALAVEAARRAGLALRIVEMGAAPASAGAAAAITGDADAQAVMDDGEGSRVGLGLAAGKVGRGGKGRGVQQQRDGVEAWHEQLPLLNGSVRVGAGVGGAGGGGGSRPWSGRTVMAKRVVEMWFSFEHGSA